MKNDAETSRSESLVAYASAAGPYTRCQRQGDGAELGMWERGASSHPHHAAHRSSTAARP